MLTLEVVVVEAVEVLTSLDPIRDGIEQTLVFTVGRTGRATMLVMLAQTATQVIRP